MYRSDKSPRREKIVYKTSYKECYGFYCVFKDLFFGASRQQNNRYEKFYEIVSKFSRIHTKILPRN